MDLACAPSRPWLLEAALIDYPPVTLRLSPQALPAMRAAYERELIRVRDRIADMEADYRRTEGDNVELWGRL